MGSRHSITPEACLSKKLIQRHIPLDYPARLNARAPLSKALSMASRQHQIFTRVSGVTPPFRAVTPLTGR
jgi:hypothetical protein